MYLAIQKKQSVAGPVIDASFFSCVIPFSIIPKKLKRMIKCHHFDHTKSPIFIHSGKEKQEDDLLPLQKTMEQ